LLGLEKDKTSDGDEGEAEESSEGGMQIATWRTARKVRVSSLPLAAPPPPPAAEEAEGKAEDGATKTVDAAGARGTPLPLPLLLPRMSAALIGRLIPPPPPAPPAPAIPTGGGDGSA